VFFDPPAETAEAVDQAAVVPVAAARTAWVVDVVRDDDLHGAHAAPRGRS
jgi:hypothetical protein